MMITRRDFCRTAATATVGTLALSGVAAGDHTDGVPEHVRITFDRDYLEAYRPRLDLSAVRNHPDDVLPTAMYGWVAKSEEFNTDALVFFTEFPYQQGILPWGVDSHHKDHEPLYCFVDSDTGELREVVYSAYHWLRGRMRTPPLYDDTHPMCTVVSPHHQYTIGQLTDGEFVDVEPLGTGDDLTDPEMTTEFEDWLDDEDFHDALAPGVVTNPWRLSGVTGREHWWRDGRAGVSPNAAYVSALLFASRAPGVNFGGANASDKTE